MHRTLIQSSLSGSVHVYMYTYVKLFHFDPSVSHQALKICIVPFFGFSCAVYLFCSHELSKSLPYAPAVFNAVAYKEFQHPPGVH